MIVKQTTIFEEEIKGRRIALECSPDCTYMDVKEVLEKMHAYICKCIESIDSQSSTKQEE